MHSYCSPLPLVRANGSGDSYTTIDYDVNGPPPSESNPLGNPPYPGHTTTGGPNWVLLHLFIRLLGSP